MNNPGANSIRHCSQPPSVILWTSPSRRPLAGSSSSSPGLHYGPSWWSETEGWSPQTILAQNRGGWPAANESRTIATAKRCAQDRSAWRLLVATATSSTSSWRRIGRRVYRCDDWLPSNQVLVSTPGPRGRPTIQCGLSASQTHIFLVQYFSPRELSTSG